MASLLRVSRGLRLRPGLTLPGAYWNATNRTLSMGGSYAIKLQIRSFRRARDVTAEEVALALSNRRDKTTSGDARVRGEWANDQEAPQAKLAKKGRLEELKALIEAGKISEDHQINVRAAMADLEAGKPTSSFYQEGKGRESEELVVGPSAPRVWHESAPRTYRFSKLTRKVSSFSRTREGTHIRLEVRLCPKKLGYEPPKKARIQLSALYDTGCDMLSLWDDDMDQLKPPPDYINPKRNIEIMFANGDTRFEQRIDVNIRLLDAETGRPVSGWIDKIASVGPKAEGVPRLTGSRMMDAWFLCSAPNNKLYISESGKSLGNVLRSLKRWAGL
ncbi:hypothetical protein TWF696_000400 [Orbilia brochopaga]|uniref:Uncharacterized protein n=1 Tax=Orbilia brochopaga TaxID=3140254 RepID=A0AAV9VB65_9PEZI